MAPGRDLTTLSAAALALLLLALGPAAGEGRTAVEVPSCNGTAGGSAAARADAWCPAVCPGCPACPSAPPCPLRVPPGYQLHEGLGYYKMHYEYFNWQDAKAACEREGGYLVVLNSEAEAELTLSFVLQYDIDVYMHVGFSDVTESGTYVTVLDQPLSETGYAVWAPGEPNNVGKELCGALKPNKGLNDGLCGDRRPFLCELFA